MVACVRALAWGAGSSPYYRRRSIANGWAGCRLLCHAFTRRIECKRQTRAWVRAATTRVAGRIGDSTCCLAWRNFLDDLMGSLSVQFREPCGVKTSIVTSQAKPPEQLAFT